MTNQTSASTTMADIEDGQLFILAGVGVLRKTHPCQGTHKNGNTSVVYPYEAVRLLDTSKKRVAR